MKPSILAALCAGASLALVACGGTETAENPIVTTEYGALEGVTDEAVADGAVEVFRGIPYAAPPVGDLRWHAPVEPASWEGTRSAAEFGNDCFQIEYETELSPLATTPSEDCLYLNVWRPAGTQSGAGLPVLIWIHGGGFINGGSSAPPYSGGPMAAKGLVTVSMNYRMGRLGFFAHPALANAGEGPQGNWGLMDQQAALEWVQRNIEAFGGDPDNVTIMGESAGAGSVVSHMSSPGVHEAFDKAIIMSGSRRGGIMTERRISEDLPDLPSAETLGVRFAERLGVEGDGPEALAALRALTPQEVSDDINMRGGFRDDYSGVVVDGITAPDIEEGIFAVGGQAMVPVMIGATSADSSQMDFATKEEAFATYGANADAAREAYDADGQASPEQLSRNIGADLIQSEPARALARVMSAAGQPVYYFRFSYVADKDAPDSPFGAAHASDVAFMLDTAALRYGDRLTETDAMAAANFSEYVANFVKSGVPSAEGHPAWPTIDEANTMMDFSASGEPVVGPDPWTSRLDLAQQYNQSGGQ